jgi:hypothetical protein
MLDESTIAAELERLTGGLERIEPGLLRTVIQAEGVSFRLFVRRAGGWIRLEVSPLFTGPEDDARRAALHRELLQRNRTLCEARFSLGDDGEPVLEAVVDAGGGLGELGAALDALVAAMQGHYPELRARYGRSS